MTKYKLYRFEGEVTKLKTLHLLKFLDRIIGSNSFLCIDK